MKKLFLGGLLVFATAAVVSGQTRYKTTQQKPAVKDTTKPGVKPKPAVALDALPTVVTLIRGITKNKVKLNCVGLKKISEFL